MLSCATTNGSLVRVFSPVPIYMFIFISVNFLFDELKSDDILRTLLPIIFFGRVQNEKGEENLCDTY